VRQRKSASNSKLQRAKTVEITLVWADFEFEENSNKDFEGLSWVNRYGNEYLLALCEGNNCIGSKAGGGRREMAESRFLKRQREAGIE
jgi:hypothetical protein